MLKLFFVDIDLFSLLHWLLIITTDDIYILISLQYSECYNEENLQWASWRKELQWSFCVDELSEEDIDYNFNEI